MSWAPATLLEHGPEPPLAFSLASEGDSDPDSELEDRVDGVKSWLSKNKGSSKSVSEDGSLKSSRPTLDSAGKEAKEGEERPASVLSSLSYRKRANLKDSIGGKGDEESLFSTLSERPASPDRSFRKASRNSVAGGLDEGGSLASWKKPLGGGMEELNERGSVLSQTFSEASRRLPKGQEKRWSVSAAELDRASVLSGPVSQSGASWGSLDAREDDTRSSLSLALSSPGSLRRSASRLDDLSPSHSRPGSRVSLSRSRLDDAASVALSDSRSLCSQHSLSRSLSVPPRPRTSTSEDLQADEADIRPVGHRSYLDPDLEAAISEVLNYKPIKFRCSSRDPDSEEEDRRSVHSAKSVALLETVEHPASSLRRSASALDFYRPHQKTKGRRSRKRSNSSSSDSSSSSSSSSSSERQRKSSKRHAKKSKKKSKKKKQQRSRSGSSSESSSSSTVSYRSNSSIKKGPKWSDGEGGSVPREGGHEARKSSKQLKKEEKQHKKQVDSLMMKYLYRPESD
ncbi:suppressor protein SRP40-like [Python bivittatus]|uniref:Suppressor protein SRP40-like n=1 Tax=Python bivittatus TaxID=176946 RepID=A0A9F2RFM3_PYTBI|nr:suppressor protein SRP40-like [Python bivittatus]